MRAARRAIDDEGFFIGDRLIAPWGHNNRASQVPQSVTIPRKNVVPKEGLEPSLTNVFAGFPGSIAQRQHRALYIYCISYCLPATPTGRNCG